MRYRGDPSTATGCGCRYAPSRVGEIEERWCGRWESNPHEEKSPEDFHAVYGFRRPDAHALQHSRSVCGLDYPFTVSRKVRGLGAARLVSTPSRLVAPGLARDCHCRFPRIRAVLHRRFPGEHSSLLKSSASAIPPRPHGVASLGKFITAPLRQEATPDKACEATRLFSWALAA